MLKFRKAEKSLSRFVSFVFGKSARNSYFLRTVFIFLRSNFNIANTSTLQNISQKWDFDKWNEYRLGDIVKQYRDEYTEHPCVQWPLSIGCMYVKATSNPNDIEVLQSIISNWSRSTFVPNETEAVAHVRIGDGLCGPDCWNDAKDCFRYKGTKYALPKQYYECIVPKLKDVKISKVIFVAANHSTRGSIEEQIFHDEWGKDYLKKVKAFFRNRGFEVHIREPRAPDEDFAFMAKSGVFVQGGGGYSGLIGRIVENRKNVVLRVGSIENGPMKKLMGKHQYDSCQHYMISRKELKDQNIV